MLDLLSEYSKIVSEPKILVFFDHLIIIPGFVDLIHSDFVVETSLRFSSSGFLVFTFTSDRVLKLHVILVLLRIRSEVN